MKSIVIALICFAAAIAVVNAVPTIEEKRSLFATYLSNHGKTYKPLEFQRRFQIFSKNVDLVHKHNEEAAAGKHSFHLSLNKFADMTNEEYKMMLGVRVNKNNVKNTTCSAYQAPSKNVTDTVDWRTKGVVTGVKDQGQCGSCWSFSATGCMEGRHALATGTLLLFSEQNFVDCVNGGADTCSVGGEMQDAFSYAIDNGIESESEYPYCACSNGNCKFDKSKVVAKFSSCYNVPTGDENALKVAAFQQPISVAIDASSIFFQLYGGGVYNDGTCKNKVEDLDHGVLVVGYGTYSGTEYWLVKNSWGSSWGLSGYIMMSRNKSNQCGIATDASFIL